jgi:hypothetical protein
MMGVELPEGPPPPDKAAVGGSGFNRHPGGIYGGLSGFSSSGSSVVTAKAAQSAFFDASSSFKVELFPKVAESLRFDIESAIKPTLLASIGIHEVTFDKNNRYNRTIKVFYLIC